MKGRKMMLMASSRYTPGAVRECGLVLTHGGADGVSEREARKGRVCVWMADQTQRAGGGGGEKSDQMKRREEV